MSAKFPAKALEIMQGAIHGHDTERYDNCAWIAQRVFHRLFRMPHPDSLALARELAGPEWAVVERVASVEMLQAGRDAYRATHLGGLSGMTIDAQIRAQCCREGACWPAMIAASEKETP